MKNQTTPNLSGDFVRNAAIVEAQNAISELLNVQSFMACDWYNWFDTETNRAEKGAEKGETPKSRKGWQARLAAIERARVLVGAALSYSMRTVGTGAADVLDKELRDPFAHAFANELRNFEPRKCEE